MLVFGIVLTTLGSVLPSIMERFGIDKAEAGSLFLLMTLGILGASLIFGPLVDRYGYKGMLLAATVLVAAALEGIALAQSMIALRFAVIVIGFGGGIINGASNALVADISGGERAASLNLLGVSFGVGAMAVPFALGVLSNRFSQSAIVAGVGVLVLLVVVLIAIPAFPAPKQPNGFPIAAAGQLVRDKLILLMGVMLFLQSGIEITVGGWTSTFVTEVLAVPPRDALIILSLYWMGMMLARLALGFLLRRTSPFRALYACLGIALVGSALLLTTRTVGIAAAGVFMLGVGFAAMFPTVLSFIGDRYAALSGTAFSVALAIALCGGMLLPWLAGILGMEFGMRGSLAIVPAALLALAALLGVLSRRLRPLSPIPVPLGKQ
ncbi:MAG TPA: MFS transporter [Gemmatimonadaceae bacterium]|nr:MFS transporter [Gemmatimonadaceae bacterium]